MITIDGVTFPDWGKALLYFDCPAMPSFTDLREFGVRPLHRSLFVVGELLEAWDGTPLTERSRLIEGPLRELLEAHARRSFEYDQHGNLLYDRRHNVLMAAQALSKYLGAMDNQPAKLIEQFRDMTWRINAISQCDDAELWRTMPDMEAERLPAVVAGISAADSLLLRLINPITVAPVFDAIDKTVLITNVISTRRTVLEAVRSLLDLLTFAEVGESNLFGLERLRVENPYQIEQIQRLPASKSLDQLADRVSPGQKSSSESRIIEEDNGDSVATTAAQEAMKWLSPQPGDSETKCNRKLRRREILKVFSNHLPTEGQPLTGSVIATEAGYFPESEFDKTTKSINTIRSDLKHMLKSKWIGSVESKGNIGSDKKTGYFLLPIGRRVLEFLADSCGGEQHQTEPPLT